MGSCTKLIESSNENQIHVVSLQENLGLAEIIVLAGETSNIIKFNINKEKSAQCIGSTTYYVNFMPPN